jgi:hypothetical protein
MDDEALEGPDVSSIVVKVHSERGFVTQGLDHGPVPLGRALHLLLIGDRVVVRCSRHAPRIAMACSGRKPLEAPSVRQPHTEPPDQAAGRSGRDFGAQAAYRLPRRDTHSDANTSGSRPAYGRRRLFGPSC